MTNFHVSPEKEVLKIFICQGICASFGPLSPAVGQKKAPCLEEEHNYEFMASKPTQGINAPPGHLIRVLSLFISF